MRLSALENSQVQDSSLLMANMVHADITLNNKEQLEHIHLLDIKHSLN